MSASTSRRLSGASARPRVFSLVGSAVIALSIVACGTKAPAELAAESLDKGLQAHVAGDLAAATTAYQDCLKQEPLNKFCHYNLGLIAQTQGDNVTAENEYRLALSQDPNYSPAIFNLAIVRTAQGDSAEALALYKKYVELSPDSAGGHLNYGLLLVATGSVEEGNAEIARAIAIDPTISVPVQTTEPTAAPAPSQQDSTPSPS